MPRGWKARQVRANLSQNDLDDAPPNSRNLVEPLHNIRVRLEAACYLRVDALDAGVQAVEQGELLLY